MPVTIQDLSAHKARGERFAMLTAYDYYSARILDEAGIPVLLVGDSLGMVMLGYDTTLPVSMEECLHHTRAVARGTRRALVVGDMPFGSYQAGSDLAVANAAALLKAGANAVKLEGGLQVVDLIARMVSYGIPVMGHLGLTPQSVNAFGGYKVQGRGKHAAQIILEAAQALQEAGAFSIVLEAIPPDLAAKVTASASIPTIGIGAGPSCDAQVLVFHDFLGISSGQLPRFVKRYANLDEVIATAAKDFARDVGEGTYPGPEHTYA
ncbi:MAG: 3-methyl-2-oxobutanoate hydroxymethyltransferase [Actinomycetota bacterium]